MSSRSLSFGGGSGASSTVHSPLSSGRISRHQTKLFSNGGQLHLNEAALAAAVGDTRASAGAAGGDDAADRDEELLALEGQLGREEAQELQQLFSILDKVRLAKQLHMKRSMDNLPATRSAEHGVRINGDTN